jgi:hypothetical protein
VLGRENLVLVLEEVVLDDVVAKAGRDQPDMLKFRVTPVTNRLRYHCGTE